MSLCKLQLRTWKSPHLPEELDDSHILSAQDACADAVERKCLGLPGAQLAHLVEAVGRRDADALREAGPLQLTQLLHRPSQLRPRASYLVPMRANKRPH